MDEYIKTGEPVGSKLLSELLSATGFRVSAATIRNEMAALEQQGYLEQPHTSAGRVPTVKGYRLYIERLIPQSTHSALSDEDKLVIDAAVKGICGDSDEAIIESASHALASLTKCAVVSTNNAGKFSVITKVEVIPTGKRVYVLLLITSGGEIKNKVCRLSFDLTDEQLSYFSEFAQANLSGVNLDSVSESFVDNLGTALGSYMAALSPLLKAVSDLSGEVTAKKVSFEGEANLIAFQDLQKQEIMSILENKNAFTQLLDSTFSGVDVILGSEHKSDTFAVSNAGIIAGSFRKHGVAAGNFGVIGPMRLDYKKLVPYIDYFAVEVTKLLSLKEDSISESESE